MPQNKFFNIPVVDEGIIDPRFQPESADKPLGWLDKLVQGIIGAIGIESGAPIGSDIEHANLAGQLLTAGLPFMAFGKKGLNVLKTAEGEIPRVFHGTQKIFDKFNPELYDKSDVLGWMTHFAENPNYAGEGYALGGYKHSGIPDWVKESPEYYSKAADNYLPRRPQMIPAKIEAKNVLDLVDPNADDLAQALAAKDPYERQRAISLFKGEIPNSERFGNTKHDFSSSSAGQRTKYLADNLRLSPSEFSKTPFDAIRYHDMGEKSWAVPKGTPIKSAISPSHDFAEIAAEHPLIKGFQGPYDRPTGNLPVKHRTGGTPTTNEELINIHYYLDTNNEWKLKNNKLEDPWDTAISDSSKKSIYKQPEPKFLDLETIDNLQKSGFFTPEMANKEKLKTANYKGNK